MLKLLSNKPAISSIQKQSIINSRSCSPRFQAQQSRHFLDSILSSALGPCPLRSLTHTKTLPYSSSSIFRAVSDVSGYPTFLPFTVSSKVTARDEAGYPTRAQLKVGYDKLGLEENWDSIVKCDPGAGTIEAKSSDQNSQGLFEVLTTRWFIRPLEQSSNPSTYVRLDVDVKFHNPIYDQMFAQFEGKVASSMISAFERRVRSLENSTSKG